MGRKNTLGVTPSKMVDEDWFVRKFAGMARGAAQKFAVRYYDRYEDCYVDALIGIWRACRINNNRTGVPRTLMMRCMANEMKEGLRRRRYRKCGTGLPDDISLHRRICIKGKFVNLMDILVSS